MNKYLLSALILAAFSGCGTSLPPTADPGRAKAALESALDAWCQGDTVDSLRQRSPAVHFNDELWDYAQRLETDAVLS